MSNGSSQDELELVHVDRAQVIAKAILVGYGIILVGIAEYFIFSFSRNWIELFALQWIAIPGLTLVIGGLVRRHKIINRTRMTFSNGFSVLGWKHLKQTPILNCSDVYIEKGIAQVLNNKASYAIVRLGKDGPDACRYYSIEKHTMHMKVAEKVSEFLKLPIVEEPLELKLLD